MSYNHCYLSHYYLLRADENQGQNHIGTSMAHRRWASLSLGQEVTVVPYDPFVESPFVFIIKLDVEVGFLRKTVDSKDHFDTEEMTKIYCMVFFFYLHYLYNYNHYNHYNYYHHYYYYN